MKAYVITTGLMFLALALAHVSRVFWESKSLATNPENVIVGLIALGMSIWAFTVVRRAARGSGVS
jgi:thiol:disulfide interchange protein